jgi:hypothetical protein
MILKRVKLSFFGMKRGTGIKNTGPRILVLIT